jgi:hypothetical protein
MLNDVYLVQLNCYKSILDRIANQDMNLLTVPDNTAKDESNRSASNAKDNHGDTWQASRRTDTSRVE